MSKSTKVKKNLLKRMLVMTVVISMVLAYSLPAFAQSGITLNQTATSLPSLGQLTKNGAPNADIFIGSNANGIIKFAATELQGTIKRISGAELPIVDSLSADRFHIIIGTPDSLPEISSYADDINWIADSDGFAIRKNGNKIYIFGKISRGALNGVYDFLEENADIIWTRGVDELGTLFTANPTIELTKVDYREQSPFRYRGWNACGQGSSGNHHTDPPTRYFETRNKINYNTLTEGLPTVVENDTLYNGFGMEMFGHQVNLEISKYFDEHPDWFMTKADGTPFKSQYGSNLNFWSTGAAEQLAADIVARAKSSGIYTINHSIQDNQYFCMVQNGIDLASQPFTAENGVTVYPEDDNYKSTIFFSFLNKVARKVKELCPERTIDILSLAYIYAEYAPAMPVENNITLVFAPIFSDDHLPIETSPSNAVTKKNIDDWSKMTKNVLVYNYYFSLPSTIYSRPISKKVQQDYQYYAQLGLLGTQPEGNVDSSVNTPGAAGYNSNQAWDMNTMYIWQINQLMWDPYADLDALTQKYCRLAYGDAAADMLKYYELIQRGWDMYDDYVWYTSGGDTYILQFIINAGIADEVIATLDAAYAKVKGPDGSPTLAEKRIEPIRKTMKEQLAIYSKFESEDGVAYFSDLGKDELIKDDNLNFETGPWSEIKPLTVFKSPALNNSTRDLQVRLIWDNENIYVATKNSNPNITATNNPYEKYPPLTADGSWWNGGGEFMETYLVGHASNLGYMRTFYTDPIGQQIGYSFESGPTYLPGPYNWKSYNKIHQDKGDGQNYWMNVIVVPFSDLGVTSHNAVLAANFVFNIYDYQGNGNDNPYYGWCGGNVWSTSALRRITMEGQIVTPEKAIEDLTKLCNEIKALDGSLYMPETWNALQAALTVAEAALAKTEPTIEELNDALSNLKKAKNGLKLIATEQDRAELKALINDYKQIPNTYLSAEDYLTFRTALSVANEAAFTQYITAADIEKALKNLEKVYDELPFYATENDIAKLQAVIDSNKKLAKGNYTDASFKALQDAIVAAEAVIVKENVLVSEIKAQITSVHLARTSLAFIIEDKTALQNEYNKYKIIKNDGFYNVDSFNRLTTALSSALSVLNNPKATVKEIEAVKSALVAAANGLIYQVSSQTTLDLTNANSIGNGLFKANVYVQNYNLTNTAVDGIITRKTTDKYFFIRENIGTVGSRLSFSTGNKKTEEYDITKTYVEIPFYGTGFAINGIRDTVGAFADVYVDGVLQEQRQFKVDNTPQYASASFSCYGNNGLYNKDNVNYYPQVNWTTFNANPAENDVELYRIDNLKEGKHTLKIVPVRRDSKASSPYFADNTFKWNALMLTNIDFFNTSTVTNNQDNTDLQMLYSLNKDLVASDYQVGFDVYQEKLNNAKLVLNKASQKEIDKATEIVNKLGILSSEKLAEIESILYKPSKEQKAAAVKVLGSLAASTPESIAAAKATLALNNGLTQDEYNKILAVINNISNASAKEIAAAKVILDRVKFNNIENVYDISVVFNKAILFQDTNVISMKSLIDTFINCDPAKFNWGSYYVFGNAIQNAYIAQIPSYDQAQLKECYDICAKMRSEKTLSPENAQKLKNFLDVSYVLTTDEINAVKNFASTMKAAGTLTADETLVLDNFLALWEPHTQADIDIITAAISRMTGLTEQQKADNLRYALTNEQGRRTWAINALKSNAGNTQAQKDEALAAINKLLVPDANLCATVLRIIFDNVVNSTNVDALFNFISNSTVSSNEINSLKALLSKDGLTEEEVANANAIINSNDFTAENKAILIGLLQKLNLASSDEINAATQGLQAAIANLVHIPITYNINVTVSGNGSTSHNGTVVVNENGELTITITPEEGYIINSIVVDGILQEVSDSYTFTTVNAHHTIDIAFAKELVLTPPEYDPNDPFYANCTHMFVFDKETNDHYCLKCGLSEETHCYEKIEKLEKEIDALEAQLRILARKPFTNRHEIKNVLMQIQELKKEIMEIRFHLVKMKVECLKNSFPCLKK